MAKLIEFVRALTDGAIDAASDYGKFAARKTLEKIISRGRKNFRLSVILNAVMLVIATGIAFFIRVVQKLQFLNGTRLKMAKCGVLKLNRIFGTSSIIKFFGRPFLQYNVYLLMK